MAGLMCLGTPIIHVFFEHGAFSAHDTAGTASALLGFSIGLWAFGSYRILATTFYSLQDTRTPAIVAVCSVGVNIALSLWLMTPLGHMGLALAAGLAAIFNTLTLIAILHRRLQGLSWKPLTMSIGRTILALAPLVGLALWVAGLSLWQTQGNLGLKVFWLTAAMGGGALSYFGVHQIFQSPELSHLKMMIRKKIPNVSPM